MIRHFRPLASVGVACAVSSAAIVTADEPRAEPPKVEVKTETKEQIVVPAPVRDMIKVDRKARIPQGVVIQGEMIKIDRKAQFPRDVVIQNGVLIPQGLNVQAVEHQTTVFRTVLRAEYQIVLAACDPTKDQRKEIARAGERALKVAARAAAQWQGSVRRVVVRNGASQVETTGPQPDPRGVIRDALAAAVKAQLSDEQTARYRKEVELRSADEKQTAVRNLVERLDHLLLLSAEQRQTLADAFSANWDESWRPSLQTFLVNENNLVFPMIPEPILAPVLSRDQARIWQTTPKIQRTSWPGYVGQMGMDSTPLEDADLAALPKPDDPEPEGLR